MPLAIDRRALRGIAAGAVLLVTLGLSACALPSTPSATSKARSIPSGGTLSPAVLVKRVALVNADLSNGSTVRLMPAGDQVTGQVTLSNCGSTFTTEAYRVARHQIAVLPAIGSRITFSNEVVAYDSAAHAAAALDELRASVTNCPTDVFVPSTVKGQPAIRYDVSKLSTLPSLPIKDNAVQTIAISAEGTHDRAYGMTIFQRQGAVLDIVYLQSQTPPTAGKLDAARLLAATTGKRLAETLAAG